VVRVVPACLRVSASFIRRGETKDQRSEECPIKPCNWEIKKPLTSTLVFVIETKLGSGSEERCMMISPNPARLSF
jgi:hypothetical protein